jgi:predicted O-linked N-acetylglucosamine transferase (SPINDLY family)
MGSRDAAFEAALAAYGVGDLPEAERALAALLADEPTHAEALHLTALIALARGQRETALACLDAALAARPAFAEALNTLGSIQRARGREEDARRTFERAIELEPRFFEAHLNLGLLVGAGGAHAAAERAYRRALEIQPDSPKALRCLAASLLGQGRLEDATELAQRARSLAPTDAAIVPLLLVIEVRRAEGLLARGRHDDGIVALRRVLAANPKHHEAHELLLRALDEVCDWTSARPTRRLLLREAKRHLAAARPPVLGPAVVTWNANAALHRAFAEQWSRALEVPGAVRTHAPGARRERLRIGYVSGAFRNHATAHLVAGLFAHHDRARFEVYAFAYGPPDDSPWRARIEATVDVFEDLGAVGDEEAAARIEAAGIDVLVDLEGHTKGARLGIFARRPAPIQATWLGYPGTTGARFIDYVIGDRVVTPAGEADRFTEKLVLLPDSYQVNDDRDVVAEDGATRRSAGLPDGAFVFCFLGQTWKIREMTWSCWMRLLEAQPRSVLWLYRANDRAPHRLRTAAQSAGIDGDRLVFADHVPRATHLARLALADLALDTHPCNGHTTTSDALRAGLPVVTMRGKHFAGRVSESLLSALGLSELVAKDPRAYEKLALRLARSRDDLGRLRDRLAEARERAPLFDTARTVRHLEAAYDRMWARHATGREPALVQVGG